ncbi:MAG TPA: hypothetical protein VM367_02770 [Pseudonocardia sp.]|jgi:predicted ATPase|nr:hypothetical protein [Pseudonocardia sp.]
MAVHAGPAQRRGGTWLGPALGHTSRLAGAAADGQVVCSHVAAAFAEDDLPTGVGLVDLGEHRLTDLARPERVYQVTHPDLPRDFPPLRSLDAGRHNLPVALTSFVGREREVREVVALLARSRVLTLTGAGGSGKTRLALQATVGALDRFPDGGWLVELAPVRDPDLLADQVGAALGLPADAPMSPERRLCAHLAARRLLLVLDNCEHVVAGAARLVHTVLTRCPDVTVLATSREVLGVPGEVVWTVPPLSLPPDHTGDVEDLAGSDAVALFCERARAAQPGFRLRKANAAAVGRICQRLDGLPLGLELAAGKVRVLGVHQVAERLDDRFRLLTNGSRTTVPRHQTLQAAMDWGYALLRAPEQVVLRRLSVFRGSFTPAAAEAVVGTAAPLRGVDVLGLLGRLVDKSMVSVAGYEPEVRYVLLETVREYAGRALADAGETDDARRRHRDFFLDLADRWASGSDYWNWGLWLRRISADRDDFAAALEWSSATGDDEELLRLAVAHWPYWYWGEAPGWRPWLVTALGRCATPCPARVEALIALATLLARTREDPARSAALFHEARDVAAGLPDPQPLAQVDFYRAHMLLSDGQRRAAEGLLRGALARSGNTDFLGWCHWGLGWVALRDDHLDQAVTAFRASLQIAEAVDDESMRAHVNAALALVAALGGDRRTAAATAARAVRSAELMQGAPRVLMMALALAGQTAALIDDGSAGDPVSRLLRLLKDKAVTYWADEALAVGTLVLADRNPEEAAVILSSLGAGSGIGVLRDRLRRCRAQLVETLGPERWRETQRRGDAMRVDEAVVTALAALERLDAPVPNTAVSRG